MTDTPRTTRAYRLRLAQGAEDIAAAQRLRGDAFATGAPDADRFDATARHILIEAAVGGALVGCCRATSLPTGRTAASASYSAQYYDLAPLAALPGPFLEIGRFCLRPGLHDPDILRLAWAGIARVVAAEGVAMLFGCTSFPGASSAAHRPALSWLGAHHLAPACWRPLRRAPETVALADGPVPSAAAAMRALPPLLRSYVAMGGRVSDHAVVDRDMDTLHVFTGLEVAAIPAARQRQLRALAEAVGAVEIDGPRGAQ